MERKIRILVAEDFDLLREDLCELLDSQEDMEAAGSAGGKEEIVKLARKMEFDLILMDIEMEYLTSGIEAAEQIRNEKPEAQIIFLTAHDTNQMIYTAMGAGAVDYIVKGCPDEELLFHIRSAFSGKPVMEAKIQKMLMSEYSRLRRSEQSLLFFITNVGQLTPVERELVRLLLQNYKVGQIAELRVVELVTVKTQIKSLLRKFNCTRTKEIVNLIHELKLEHLFL